MLNKNTLKEKGESALPIKVVKYKGTTTVIKDEFGVGHSHQFVVYEDDTVELFDYFHKNSTTGETSTHTHEYMGEYPHGYMLEEQINGVHHVHKIASVSHPVRIKKTLFGPKSFNKLVPRSFKEFHKSEASEVDLKKFWEDYHEAFGEIPKKGPTESHEYLIKASLSHYNDYTDPRDDEILEHLARIVELEQELAQQDDLNKEHPIFKNGTFLKEPDKPTVYYMDEGRKRQIKAWDTYLVLKRAQGHLEETPDEEVWILVTEDVIKGLPSGPEFQTEDLYGDEEERKKAEDRRIVQLDPDDFIADPSNYPTVSDYIAALDKETRQLLAKEEYLESVRYRYQRDLGARGPVELTPEERKSAQSRLDIVTPDLLKTRRTIIRYTKILERVDPDGDLKNIEIDTSQLKDIVTGEMKKKVSSKERNTLIGKNIIDRFLKGKKSTDKKKNQSSGTTTPAVPTSTAGALAAAGMGGMQGMGSFAGEPQPKAPPSGYVSNPNNLLKNDTIGEAGHLMRLGVSSPKGDWYWGLKYKSGKEETPKLENGLYKKWKDWKPIGTTSLVNPYEKPVSRYYWSLSKFEWIPKAGTLGIKHRYWHGKKIDSMR